MTNITEVIAKKVLETVDAGLSIGRGKPKPGEMCVEAAVCYAMGLPHGDNPPCVSPAIRSLKIALNDSAWSSKAARAKGMRRLAIIQLGSAGVIDDNTFTKKVADYTIRSIVSVALRAAADIHPLSGHKDALFNAATLCEREGTAASARSAYSVAASAACSAYSSARSPAYLAACSAYSSAYSSAASAVAASVACSAYSAVAASVAASVASDKVLSDFAEGVVQILVAMKAPGAQWLSLTE